MKRRIKGYWNKENCRIESLKYMSRKDFKRNSKGAYDSARKNNWLDEICTHMIKKIEKMPCGYWTIEKCISEATKYKNRKDFRLNSRKAYSITIKNKWVDIVCKNLPGSKSKNYWTKENCAKEALKYKTRIDFETNSSSACQTARRNKWMDEICMHMLLLGNKFKRCIYAYEFVDNSVYIGLTFNINKRKNQHLSKKRKSSVQEHILKTGLHPILKQLTDYINIEDAIKLEEDIKNNYKNMGWNILNKVKCGATGSNKLKWTKERCFEEAFKYNKRSEFKKNARSAYNSACRHGWLQEIFLKLKY